jgi:hypothetical protein
MRNVVGRKAIVKISESVNNKNKLYYACADGCDGWIGWCLPIHEPFVSSSTGDASDSVSLQLHELQTLYFSRSSHLSDFNQTFFLFLFLRPCYQ